MFGVQASLLNRASVTQPIDCAKETQASDIALDWRRSLIVSSMNHNAEFVVLDEATSSVRCVERATGKTLWTESYLCDALRSRTQQLMTARDWELYSPPWLGTGG